jgi:hypothetical protein
MSEEEATKAAVAYIRDRYEAAPLVVSSLHLKEFDLWIFFQDIMGDGLWWNTCSVNSCRLRKRWQRDAYAVIRVLFKSRCHCCGQQP